MFYVSVSPPAAHGQDDGARPGADHHLPGSDGAGSPQPQGRRGGGRPCMYPPFWALTLLTKGTYNKYICQKTEKQYIAVDTVLYDMHIQCMYIQYRFIS